MDIEAIKTAMISAARVEASTLGYITQELIDQYEVNAKPVEADDEMKALRLWTGNHFVDGGATWYWKDSIGNQCGQDRPWKYNRQQGASYGQAGNCPQGYPYWNINVP